MPDYTTEDLLLYIYSETSNEQTAAIEKQLQKEWALQEKFQALTSYLNELDSIMESPRPQSVNAILDYARASAEVV